MGEKENMPRIRATSMVDLTLSVKIRPPLKFKRSDSMATLTCICNNSFSVKIVEPMVKCPFCGATSTYEIMLREMEDKNG